VTPLKELPLLHQSVCAHKKGEVVEPAGGETGGPHCLAEVYQPLRGASIHYLKELNKQNIEFRNSCQTKNEKQGKIARCLLSTPHFINMISIQVLAVKCKNKIDYFDFFMNIVLSGRKSQDLPLQILMFIGVAKEPIGPKKLPLSENFP